MTEWKIPQEPIRARFDPGSAQRGNLASHNFQWISGSEDGKKKSCACYLLNEAFSGIRLSRWNVGDILNFLVLPKWRRLGVYFARWRQPQPDFPQILHRCTVCARYNNSWNPWRFCCYNRGVVVSGRKWIISMSERLLYCSENPLTFTLQKHISFSSSNIQANSKNSQATCICSHIFNSNEGRLHIYMYVSGERMTIVLWIFKFGVDFQTWRMVRYLGLASWKKEI